jgi:hypothetical protein
MLFFRANYGKPFDGLPWQLHQEKQSPEVRPMPGQLTIPGTYVLTYEVNKEMAVVALNGDELSGRGGHGWVFYMSRNGTNRLCA